MATLVFGVVAVLGLNRPVSACPFCDAVSQTFAEEIDSMNLAILVKYVRKGELDPATEEIASSVFEVVEVLKGDGSVQPGQELNIHYFGKTTEGLFVVMGTEGPDVIWTSPISLSKDGVEYLRNVVQLPDSPQRLEFFLKYLEHPDEMLARDAYDEFANAPYKDIVELGPTLDHDQVVAWINDTTTVPVSRRRLYLTMLSVCGTDKDADMLEESMQSDDPDVRAGLNAMVACYLSLRPDTGLETVEQLYLRNVDSEYAATYAAIMAIRFHLAETDFLPKDDLLAALRCLLDRPDLADLVIPDLARAQDWSVLPKLVELFRDANPAQNWIRVPIVNYVRSCPLEEADDAMMTLQEIDLAAVNRASTFFPLAAKRADASNAEQEPGGAPSDAQPRAPLPPPDVDLPTATVDSSSPADDDATPDGSRKFVWPLVAVFGLVLLGGIARSLMSKSPTSS